MSAGKLLQMAVAECLKVRDDRLVRGLVTVKRLRVTDAVLPSYSLVLDLLSVRYHCG